MRKIRRLRQLVPTKFATAYRSHAPHSETRCDQEACPEHFGTATFASWWMWLDHPFRVKTHVI